MATLQEVIRRILIRGQTEGVDKATAELHGLAEAQGGVAAATEKTERSTLSLQNRINSLQKSLDAEYRAEVQLAKIHKDLDAARSQGLITATRQNELATLAAAKYRTEGEAAVKAAEGLKLLKEVSLGFVGGIGAGVLLGGITELPTAIAEAVERLGKTANVAETIGITTKALQELRFAAKQSDVEVGTLDSAMEKFSTNLGKPGSPLDKILALNKVKVTGDTLTDLEHFADLVKNASSQEERNALITAAMGKSAQEMGQLFRNGGEGIAEWAKEADHAGIMTDAQIKRARELSDEMKRLEPALKNAQDDFALLVAPIEIELLRELAGALTDIRKALDGIASGNAGAALAMLMKFATGLVPGMSTAGLAGAIDSAGKSFDNGVGIVVRGGRRPNESGSPDDRGGGFYNNVDQYLKGSGSHTKLDTSGDAAAKSYEKLLESTEKRILQLHNEADALTAAGLAADTMRNYSELLNQAEATGVKLGPERIAKLYEEADALAKAQEALAGATLDKADRSPFEIMGDQVDALSEKLDHGVISWRTYNLEVAKSAETLVNSYASAADDVIGNLENLTDAIAGQSKEAFEIHKALSIAKAVVSGGEAIVHSYSAGSAIGGPFVGAIFAGIAAAATAAQIAAIASTSYQSKSSISASGAGAGGGAGSAATATPQQMVTVVLKGHQNSSVGMSDVEGLVSSLVEHIKDGGGNQLIRVMREAA